MRHRSAVSVFFNETTLCTRVTEKYFLITGILIEHEKITLDGVYFYARLSFCSERQYPVFVVKRLLLVLIINTIILFLYLFTTECFVTIHQFNIHILQINYCF